MHTLWLIAFGHICVGTTCGCPDSRSHLHPRGQAMQAMHSGIQLIQVLAAGGLGACGWAKETGWTQATAVVALPEAAGPTTQRALQCPHPAACAALLPCPRRLPTCEEGKHDHALFLQAASQLSGRHIRHHLGR